MPIDLSICLQICISISFLSLSLSFCRFHGRSPTVIFTKNRVMSNYKCMCVNHLQWRLKAREEKERERERIVIGRDVATRELNREEEAKTKSWWRETVVWKEMEKCSISVISVKSFDFMSRSTHSIMNGMRVDTILNTHLHEFLDLCLWVWTSSSSFTFLLLRVFSFFAKKELLHCHDFFLLLHSSWWSSLSLSLVNLDC